MHKISIITLLIRIFIPLIETLSIDDISKVENLPEYAEYLAKRTTTDTNIPINFPNFPTIQLCKESPGENNIYGHIFCWGMIGLYILFVISLIIYQLRSVLWLKVVLPRKKNKDIELQGTK